MITLLIMGKHTRFCSYKVKKLLKPAHHLKFKKCQPPKKKKKPQSHSFEDNVSTYVYIGHICI